MKGGLYFTCGWKSCDSSYTEITKKQRLGRPKLDLSKLLKRSVFPLHIFISSLPFGSFLVIPVAWYSANVSWVVTDIIKSNIVHIFLMHKSGLVFDFFIMVYIYFIVYLLNSYIPKMLSAFWGGDSIVNNCPSLS